MKLLGLKELEQGITRAKERQRAGSRLAADRAAERIAGIARGLAPKQSGAMARGIKAYKSRRRGLAKARVVATTRRALHVEFGTEHMPAQPFMRPAAARGKGLAAALTRSEVKAKLERM
jgi:HK97 gp10 family phage protein